MLGLAIVILREVITGSTIANQVGFHFLLFYR